jgi:sporulation protein YlmC with PRC-barrel domain
MELRPADLRCREVINVATGGRPGFVNDVLLDLGDGRILALRF